MSFLEKVFHNKKEIVDNRIYVYLAGPLHNSTDIEKWNWRREVVKAFAGNERFVILVPQEMDTKEAAVEQDKQMLEKAHVVLVFYWKKSTGTAMEVYIGWNQKKDVYTVVSPHTKGDWWIEYHSKKVFENLDEAVKHIKYVWG